MEENNLEGFRFEVLVGVAGIISLFGFFLPWAGSPELFIYGSEEIIASPVFVGGWLLIVASLISYDIFQSPTLQNHRPYTDALLGIIGGGLVITGVYLFTTEIPPDFWLKNWIYVSIIGGVIGIAAGAALWIQQIGKTVTEKRKGGL